MYSEFTQFSMARLTIDQMDEIMFIQHGSKIKKSKKKIWLQKNLVYAMKLNYFYFLAFPFLGFADRFPLSCQVQITMSKTQSQTDRDYNNMDKLLLSHVPLYTHCRLFDQSIPSQFY